jgi:hypothetical protein
MNPKDAFHQTVHTTPGGCAALAVRLGMSPTILRNKANPNSSVNVVTIDDIDRVMELTEDYSVLHALAANHGHVCVRVEEGAPVPDMAVLEMVTMVWQTNGQVGAEVNQALADGKITRDEIVRVRDAVKSAERALEGVLARLEGMAER